MLEQVHEALRAWGHEVKFWQQTLCGKTEPVKFSGPLMQKVYPPRMHSPQPSAEL